MSVFSVVCREVSAPRRPLLVHGRQHAATTAAADDGQQQRDGHRQRCGADVRAMCTATRLDLDLLRMVVDALAGPLARMLLLGHATRAARA